MYASSSRNFSSSSSKVERTESDASTASSCSTKRNAPIASGTTTTSPLQTSSDQHDSFDNEDYDEDVADAQLLQPIGTCIALYPFDGNPSSQLLAWNYVLLVGFAG